MREDILRVAIIVGFSLLIGGFLGVVVAIIDALSGQTKVGPSNDELGIRIRGLWDLRRLPGATFPAVLFMLGGLLCAVSLAIALTPPARD